MNRKDLKIFLRYIYIYKQLVRKAMREKQMDNNNKEGNNGR